MSKRLPDKPSELIRLALADLRKVEADELYEVNMNLWHAPMHSKPVCAVCLAGAVMAMTLGAKPWTDMLPSFYKGKTTRKLSALDSFRIGEVDFALVTLGIDVTALSQKVANRGIVPYHINREGFHFQMLELADALEGAGL